MKREEVAALHGVTVFVVDKAVQWANKNFFYEVDQTVLLEKRKAELRAHISILEERASSVLRKVRYLEKDDHWERMKEESDEAYSKRLETMFKNPFVAVNRYLPLLRELRDARVQMMEIEGLIKLASAPVTNNLNQLIVYMQPKSGSSEEWSKMKNAVLAAHETTEGIKEAILELDPES